MQHFFVFLFELGQGIVVGAVDFFLAPGLAEQLGKILTQVNAKISDHIIGQSENAGKLQDALVDELEHTHIGKVVLVQKIENNDI